MTRMFSSPSMTTDELNDTNAGGTHSIDRLTDGLSGEPNVARQPTRENAHRDRKRKSKAHMSSLEASAPYPVLRLPTPHPSHQSYPNYTPPVPDHDDETPTGTSDWRWYKTKHAAGLYPDSTEDQAETGFIEADGDHTEDQAWVGPILYAT